MLPDPLSYAAEVIQQADCDRHELRLVGGLAVRLHVGTAARRTLDVDLVAMTERARSALLDSLRRTDHRVGESGGWWRAVRRDSHGQHIVDVASHPIVTPKTFDTITLRDDPLLVGAEGTELSVVGADDLATLKLLAGRDQDLVDLLLLVAHVGASARAIARNAELDDVERWIAAAASSARVAVQGSHLERLALEILGRSPGQSEVASLLEFLQDLAKEGL